MANSAAAPDQAPGQAPDRAPVQAPPPAPDQVRLLTERGAAQLLSGPPAGTAESVARRLLAIQGQDLRGAGWPSGPAAPG